MNGIWALKPCCLGPWTLREPILAFVHAPWPAAASSLALVLKTTMPPMSDEDADGIDWFSVSALFELQ